jgi:lysophospholipase L1-like esterase
MKYIIATVVLILGLTEVPARAADYPPSGLESIEWCDIWISHANETNLPRVLLIGDSITRAYYPEVEKHLDGEAYVGRLSSSAFISDPALLRQIEMVLKEYRFDIIHFNNGMHGWQHSEAEYAEAFPKFVKTIQRCAPKAKLIWASTTPLRASPEKPEKDQATDDRIARRNAIALEYVEKRGISVDDLNTPMRGHPELHGDNVHFNDQGVAIQAAQVAKAVAGLLSK